MLYPAPQQPPSIDQEREDLEKAVRRYNRGCADVRRKLSSLKLVRTQVKESIRRQNVKKDLSQIDLNMARGKLEAVNLRINDFASQLNSTTKKFKEDMFNLEELKEGIQQQTAEVKSKIAGLDAVCEEWQFGNRLSDDVCSASRAAAFDTFQRWMLIQPLLRIWMSSEEQVHNTTYASAYYESIYEQLVAHYDKQQKLKQFAEGNYSHLKQQLRNGAEIGRPLKQAVQERDMRSQLIDQQHLSMSKKLQRLMSGCEALRKEIELREQLRFKLNGLMMELSHCLEQDLTQSMTECEKQATKPANVVVSEWRALVTQQLQQQYQLQQQQQHQQHRNSKSGSGGGIGGGDGEVNKSMTAAEDAHLNTLLNANSLLMDAAALKSLSGVAPPSTPAATTAAVNANTNTNATGSGGSGSGGGASAVGRGTRGEFLPPITGSYPSKNQANSSTLGNSNSSSPATGGSTGSSRTYHKTNSGSSAKQQPLIEQLWQLLRSNTSHDNEHPRVKEYVRSFHNKKKTKVYAWCREAPTEIYKSIGALYPNIKGPVDLVMDVRDQGSYSSRRRRPRHYARPSFRRRSSLLSTTSEGGTRYYVKKPVVGASPVPALWLNASAKTKRLGAGSKRFKGGEGEEDEEEEEDEEDEDDGDDDEEDEEEEAQEFDAEGNPLPKAAKKKRKKHTVDFNTGDSNGKDEPATTEKKVAAYKFMLSSRETHYNLAKDDMVVDALTLARVRRETRRQQRREQGLPEDEEDDDEDEEEEEDYEEEEEDGDLEVEGDAGEVVSALLEDDSGNRKLSTVSTVSTASTIRRGNFRIGGRTSKLASIETGNGINSSSSVGGGGDATAAAAGGAISTIAEEESTPSQQYALFISKAEMSAHFALTARQVVRKMQSASAEISKDTVSKIAEVLQKATDVAIVRSQQNTASEIYRSTAAATAGAAEVAANDIAPPASDARDENVTYDEEEEDSTAQGATSNATAGSGGGGGMANTSSSTTRGGGGRGGGGGGGASIEQLTASVLETSAIELQAQELNERVSYQFHSTREAVEDWLETHAQCHYNACKLSLTELISTLDLDIIAPARAAAAGAAAEGAGADDEAASGAAGAAGKRKASGAIGGGGKQVGHGVNATSSQLLLSPLEPPAPIHLWDDNLFADNKKFSLQGVLSMSRNLIDSIRQNIADFHRHSNESSRSGTADGGGAGGGGGSRRHRRHPRGSDSDLDAENINSSIDLSMKQGDQRFYEEELEAESRPFDPEQYAFHRPQAHSAAPAERQQPSYPRIGSSVSVPSSPRAAAAAAAASNAFMRGNNNSASGGGGGMQQIQIPGSGNHPPSHASAPWPAQKCTLYSMECIVKGQLYVVDYDWDPTKMHTLLVAKHFISRTEYEKSTFIVTPLMISELTNSPRDLSLHTLFHDTLRVTQLVVSALNSEVIDEKYLPEIEKYYDCENADGVEGGGTGGAVVAHWSLASMEAMLSGVHNVATRRGSISRLYRKASAELSAAAASGGGGGGLAETAMGVVNALRAAEEAGGGASKAEEPQQQQPPPFERRSSSMVANLSGKPAADSSSGRRDPHDLLHVLTMRKKHGDLLSYAFPTICKDEV